MLIIYPTLRNNWYKNFFTITLQKPIVYLINALQNQKQEGQ